MLKLTPQSALFNPLDDFNLLEDVPPPTWTGDWVSRRLVEGFKTLRLIPMNGAPAQFNNSWPAYSYEWQDLSWTRPRAKPRRYGQPSASRTKSESNPRFWR